MIDYCYSEENHTSDQLYNFENALEKLEFYSVLNRIQRYVFSEPAKNSIRLIAPSISISEIQHRLKEVSEAKELLIAEGTAPLD